MKDPDFCIGSGTQKNRSTKTLKRMRKCEDIGNDEKFDLEKIASSVPMGSFCSVISYMNLE